MLRRCACGGEIGPTGECDRCRARSLAPVGAAGPPPLADVLRSSGQPLDPATRRFMEPRFGHDFSHVRVHTDGRAAASAARLDAAAYSVGRDVVMGAGRYAPGTHDGRILLAHELAHVMQAGGAATPEPVAVGRTDDPAEREAAGIAAAVVDRGGPRHGDVPAATRQDPRLVRRQPTGPGPGDITTKVIRVALQLDGFVKDSAKLSPEHLESIDKLASSVGLELGQFTAGVIAITVIGHTDTTGSDKHNTQLGAGRAESAKAALAAALRAHKVPDERLGKIAIDSKGESNLAVKTADNVDEPRNRRVEVQITITSLAPPPPPAPPLAPVGTPGKKQLLVPPPYRPPIFGPSPTLPKLPQHEWLRDALERDVLLKKLPPWARDKAIDALKDVDETALEKVIDALPWDDKLKASTKAALRALLQTFKGKKFEPPTPPSRMPDFPPPRDFGTAPGEKIIKLPEIKW